VAALRLLAPLLPLVAGAGAGVGAGCGAGAFCNLVDLLAAGVGEDWGLVLESVADGSWEGLSWVEGGVG
jgi:hypothetical protein